MLQNYNSQSSVLFRCTFRDTKINRTSKYTCPWVIWKPLDNVTFFIAHSFIRVQHLHQDITHKSHGTHTTQAKRDTYRIREFVDSSWIRGFLNADMKSQQTEIQNACIGRVHAVMSWGIDIKKDTNVYS